MRCAAPPVSLSNNALAPVLGVIFAAGALLFALGTIMVRRESQAQTPVPDAVIPCLSRDDLETRIDQIERLTMVGQPWCVEQLEREFLTDADERVRGAAEDALLVIAARGV